MSTMRIVPVLGMLAALVAMACGPDADDPHTSGTGGSSASSDGASGGAPLSVCEGGTELRPNDANNYQFSNTLDIAETTLKDHTNLVFDWSGVTTDFYGHPFDPVLEAKSVLITLWPRTSSQIEELLHTDSLSAGEYEGLLTTSSGGVDTARALLDFTVAGEPLPEDQVWAWFDTSTPNYAYPQDQHTFLFMVSGSDVLGKDARMLHLFHLDPTATETTLSVTNESTKLSFEADLDRAAPLFVPLGTPGLTWKWSDTKTKSLGTPLGAQTVTEVAVAHFTQTKAELAEKFLDLRELATDWYTNQFELMGTSVALGELQTADGAAFPGIDGSGVWVVAAFCTVSCNSPAPVIINFLEPCP
jgi:hypothetical protein